MICITGVPKTGKTTICKLLSENGIQCNSLDDIATDLGCLQNGEVDVDCLSVKLPDKRVVESHYSHLLKCDYVIVLRTDEAVLERRMKEAGYDASKIAENLDAQRSDVILSEAMESVPRNRIFFFETGNRDPKETTERIRDKIIELEQLIRMKKPRRD